MSETAHPHAVDFSGGGIFFVLCMFLGVFARLVLKKSGIPYTVLLLLFGCMVSFAVQTVEGGLGLLGDSLRGWTQLDPHVLLFIFLPALVFGSASAVDIHVFTRELGQILILAIPGVIVATVLTAAFSLVVFDYGWTWFDALTFGAMLSATDPVAVVALLKEVGASKRLSLLIEGESLFNDGTAIVIFNVFKAAMITQRIEQAAGGEGGEGVDSVAVVVTFLRVAVGGMALGLVVGKLASYVLRRIRNDTLSEITVTLFAAFATFLVAEGTALKVSGVLALVVLGMVVAADHTVISNHEAMHEFWEIAEYFANTIIFVLSGAVIVESAMSGAEHHSIGAADWGLLFVLYIALHVIRALTVLILKIPLSRTGYGLNGRQATVLVYGGLRGAVGLALALTVLRDPALEEEIGDKFVFHMSGIAFLTLLINGSTTGLLLRCLDMVRPSAASVMMFNRAVDHVNELIEHDVTQLKQSELLWDADWKEVEGGFITTLQDAINRGGSQLEAAGLAERLASYLAGDADDHEMKPGTSRRSESHSVDSHHAASLLASPESAPHPAGGKQIKSLLEDAEEDASAVDDAELWNALMTESRHRYLTLLKSTYWERFEHGQVGDEAVRQLLAAASSAQDRVSEPLNEWPALKDLLHETTHAFGCIDRNAVARRCGSSFLLGPLSFEFDVAATFIEAHKEALAMFDDVMGMPAVTAQIRLETRGSLKHAQTAIDRIDMAFKEVSRAVKTEHVIMTLLQTVRNSARGLLNHGEIEEREFEILNQAVMETDAHRPRIKPKLPSKESLLETAGFFRHLDATTREALLDIVEERRFHAGDFIIHEGQTSRGFFIVVRGTVELRRKSTEQVCTMATADGTSAAPVQDGSGDGVDTAAPGRDSRTDRRSGSVAVFFRRDSVAKEEASQLLIDKLEAGSVIGALSMLTGRAELASAVCDGPVEAFWISQKRLHECGLIKSSSSAGGLIRKVKPLEQNICQTAASLVARLMPEFRDLSTIQTRDVLKSSALIRPTGEQPICLEGMALLITGEMIRPKLSASEDVAEDSDMPRGSPVEAHGVIGGHAVDLLDALGDAASTSTSGDAVHDVDTDRDHVHAAPVVVAGAGGTTPHIRVMIVDDETQRAVTSEEAIHSPLLHHADPHRHLTAQQPHGGVVAPAPLHEGAVASGGSTKHIGSPVGVIPEGKEREDSPAGSKRSQRPSPTSFVADTTDALGESEYDSDFHVRREDDYIRRLPDGVEVEMETVHPAFVLLANEPTVPRWFTRDTRLLLIPRHKAHVFEHAARQREQRVKVHKQLSRHQQTFDRLAKLTKSRLDLTGIGSGEYKGALDGSMSAREGMRRGSLAGSMWSQRVPPLLRNGSAYIPRREPASLPRNRPRAASDTTVLERRARRHSTADVRSTLREWNTTARGASVQWSAVGGSIDSPTASSATSDLQDSAHVSSPLMAALEEGAVASAPTSGGSRAMQHSRSVERLPPPLELTSPWRRSTMVRTPLPTEHGAASPLSPRGATSAPGSPGSQVYSIAAVDGEDVTDELTAIAGGPATQSGGASETKEDSRL